jgi:hypothetical protein
MLSVTLLPWTRLCPGALIISAICELISEHVDNLPLQHLYPVDLQLHNYKHQYQLYFFFLKYAGELRIFVFKRGKNSPLQINLLTLDQ